MNVLMKVDGCAVWSEKTANGWTTICVAIKLDEPIKEGRKRVTIALGWDGERWAYGYSLEQIERYRPGLAQAIANRLLEEAEHAGNQ